MNNRYVKRVISGAAILWIALGLVVRLLANPYGLENIARGGPALSGRVPAEQPTVVGNWQVVPAFTNLVFTNALGLTFVPGTDQLVVWEREGRVWSFKNQPDVSSKSLALDLSDHCQGWGDCGLLGLAFHPGFATNRYVYVFYVAVDPGKVVGGPYTPAPTLGRFYDRLSRVTLDDDLKFVPGSELVLVNQLTACSWHNGGGLFFNPDDGFLYWTDGDDEVGRTQTISHDLLSGVFRIDVEMRGGTISHVPPRQPENGWTTNYFIPNDNPFVGQPGVLEEFFALGLRSPHRMTYDQVSKRIFIGEVGDSSWEEVDVVEPTDPKGLNFQWPAVEGFAGDLLPPYVGVSKAPLLAYGHDEGLAVIGGLVYRGSQFSADLGGKYLFTDNSSGCVWALDEKTVPPSKVLLGTFRHAFNSNPGIDNLGISSFGADDQNEIYLCQLGNQGGQIFTLQRSQASVESQKFPPLLSQTGAFSDLSTLEPAAELLPYAVNSPLWSDGAVKSRWVSMPANSWAVTNDAGNWTFPKGTVFVKHFELVTNETDTTTPLRRLETRILVVQDNGTAFGTTYRWRPDNSDADLVDNRLEEDLLIKTASGKRTQRWQYPGQTDCVTCHNPVSQGVLGVSPRQLNGDYRYPSGIVDNQLRTWNHLGLLAPGIDESAIGEMEKLASLNDETVPLETRVKSYLESNCAFCHRPGGVPALWDGRFTTPMAAASIINGGVNHGLGYMEPKIVAPGYPDRSILFVRATSTNALMRMPPLGRQEVDQSAMVVVERWIRSLANTNSTIVTPWYHDDIGKPIPTGTADFNDGVLSIAAGGPDFMYNEDYFHYVYQHFSGDGGLTARVAEMRAEGWGWAKAGIMIRESLNTGARYVAYFASPNSTSGLLARSLPYDYADRTQLESGGTPYWMRLTRTGNLYTGYYSTNGVDWVSAFEQELDISPEAYIGFAAVSGNLGSRIKVGFDHISVSEGVAPLNHAPSIVLKNPVPALPSFVSKAIVLDAVASAAPGLNYKVEYFDGIQRLGEATSPPFSYIWSNAPDGVHWLSATVTDSGGAQTASAFFPVLVGEVRLHLRNASIPSTGLSLSFVGAPGSHFALESSPDLHVWRSISTNTMGVPRIVLTDFEDVTGQRFYRLRFVR